MLAAHERMLMAVDLRLQRKTFAQIAAALGYASASGAQKAVETMLERSAQESTTAARALEIERLERLRARLEPRAFGEARPVVVEDSKGRGVAAMTQETATDRWLKASERLARLRGLDAPAKVDARVFSYTEQDVEDIVTRCRAVVRDELTTRFGPAAAAEVDAAVGARMGDAQAPAGAG